jgi:hypothetical protein
VTEHADAGRGPRRLTAQRAGRVDIEHVDLGRVAERARIREP